MEKIADIWHKRGVGDGLMFSSVIKEYYCKEYDMVYLDVPALKWLNVKLYNDVDNIVLGKKSPIYTRERSKRIVFKDSVEHTSSWRNLTWNRDLKEENKLYNEIVDQHGKDYIIIHERHSDNALRQMYPIDRSHFENKDLPVINVDGRHGNILDYATIMQKAKEIHVYEGSFMNLADSVTDGSVPLYGHLYCKPHYFDPKMEHYEIIENIKAGKWHKNNWNYIWKK